MNYLPGLFDEVIITLLMYKWNKTLKQPAHWSVTFNSPQANLQAEYWVGNTFVTVKRSDQNIFGALNNLHKGNGIGIPWILLADTLAGSIILLSLTGVVLWTQLNPAE